MKAEGKESSGERLSRFARRLLTEWRRRGWPVRGERVVAAVSGGADSTAMLLALEELKRAGLLSVELFVAHLDHGLRGEAGEEDAHWVARRAHSLGFECRTGRADVGGRAKVARDNLEQAARRARYEFLSSVARDARAAAVLTAHTLDDQAETVLLRLLRGSGGEGLGGMSPERRLEEGVEVYLRRPLLAWARRADAESYCRARGVEFLTDEMNEDERFARVRVRRQVMPLLEGVNPRAAEAIARAAELLREDSSALELLASQLLEEARASFQVKVGKEAKVGENVEESVEDGAGENVEEKKEGAWPLRVEVLAAALPALRRRALRLWLGRGRGGLRRIELAHALAVERLLEGTRGGRVAELPGGAAVERRRGLLVFRGKKVEKACP